MRKQCRVRFLAAGEYGEQRGRGHWHLVLFFQNGEVPAGIEFEKRYNHSLWPHGFSFWQEGNVKTFRYACKYAMKQLEGSETESKMFGLSTKPPLGYAYFQWLAREYVRNRLSPQNTEYYFPEVTNFKTRKPLRFFLTRASADHFCEAFIRYWKAEYGHEHWPQSDLIEDYLDAEAGTQPWNDYTFNRHMSVSANSKQIGEGKWPGQIHPKGDVMDRRRQRYDLSKGV